MGAVSQSVGGSSRGRERRARGSAERHPYAVLALHISGVSFHKQNNKARTRRRRCRGGGPRAGPSRRTTPRTYNIQGWYWDECVRVSQSVGRWVQPRGPAGLPVRPSVRPPPRHRHTRPLPIIINQANPTHARTHSSQFVSISASVGCCELSPGPSAGPVLAEAAFGSAAMLLERCWVADFVVGM